MIGSTFSFSNLRRAVAAVLISAIALPGAAQAIDVRAGDKTVSVPKWKKTSAGLYLTAEQAGEKLKDDKVVFIDLRTRAEVTFLGLPTRVNVHIPYMVMPTDHAINARGGSYRLKPNPNFVGDFEAYVFDNDLSEDTVFVVMCRSGGRSAKAASLLHSLGYRHVYSVIDGYEGDTARSGPNRGKRVVNGWKNSGHAWSYRIRASQIYPRDRS